MRLYVRVQGRDIQTTDDVLKKTSSCGKGGDTSVVLVHSTSPKLVDVLDHETFVSRRRCLRRKLLLLLASPTSYMRLNARVVELYYY